MNRAGADRLNAREHELVLLRPLAARYPNVDAAMAEIARISAVLTLPKGTVHVISDIHGEDQKLRHVINNASGSLRPLVERVFAGRMAPRQFQEFLTLIFYPYEVVQVAPSVNEMYQTQQTVFVELPQIANELDGASRPGHFRGMATVVLKLLSIVQPQVAVFGKKDYQQLHIIRQMVAQLNLPVHIVGGETVRAADGLALSSRNQYLSEDQRGEAKFLYQTLQGMQQAMLQGERDVERLQQQAVKPLVARGWAVDYVEVRNQSDLQAVSRLQGDLVVLAAARLGNTRLLDNIEICLAG